MSDKDGSCPLSLKVLITTHCVDLEMIWSQRPSQTNPYKQITPNEITEHCAHCHVEDKAKARHKHHIPDESLTQTQ